MARDKLIAVGRELYGPSWQTPLSHDLNVADRTVRRWVAGSTPTPASVMIELANICRDKADKLKDIADDIEADYGPQKNQKLPDCNKQARHANKTN